MSIETLVMEFGRLYELTDKLKTETYNLNVGLRQRDPEQTLYEYEKIKGTFKELRNLMADLNRSVAKASSELDSSQHLPETDS